MEYPGGTGLPEVKENTSQSGLVASCGWCMGSDKADFRHVSRF